MHIEDLVFIITGGASGLGAQVVHSIIGKGGFVAIFDINKENSIALVNKYGDHVCYFPGPVDVCFESQVEEALSKTRSHFSNKALAGAILCSGVLIAPSFIHGFGPENRLTSYRQFEHIMKINLLGAFCVAQKTSEILINNKPFNEDGEKGIIIILSSIVGLDGVIVGYGTSKAALAGLTLPLANELSPFGIRVMSIAPGPFDAPMAYNGLTDPIPALFPHRLGKPKELSDLVLQIIQMPMLNGSVIRMDGALRAKI